MAAELVPDVLEQILIGFDVKELMRFKCVCKSWYSFISSPGFIKAHLNHTCNKRKVVNNVEVRHVRILMAWLTHGVTRYHDKYDSYLLGSSNGLVCMSTSNAQVLVANPLTNQVKKLQDNEQIRDFESLCWGFGYDASIDDYKVIVGFRKGVDNDHRICFHVLTLKSNVWKVIGEVKYRFISRVGTLCNGALHWFMNDQNKKRVILSLRLSEEEFKEIPQPGDLLYSMYHSIEMKLGIIEECLCIFKNRVRPGNYVWKLKNHNGKESWGKAEIHTKLETLYCVRKLHDGVLNGNILFDDCISLSDEILPGAPIFVPSLVSPHVHLNDGCKKLKKGDPSGRDQRPTFDIVEGAKMTAHRCKDLLFL